jgi:hypothetical protein
MVKLTLVLEDLTVVATRKPAGWVGESYYAYTNTSRVFTVTDEQMAAIVALGIASDEWTTETARDALYSIAEPAVAGWPSDCRPMP